MNKYFLEIKNRFILLCVTWLSVLFVSYLYKETLLFTIVQPNLTVNEYTNTFYFIFTNVLEVLSVYLELIVFISVQISFIFLFYHMFLFLSSGFFYSEYLYFKFFVKIVFIIWLFSIFLATFVLVPLSWSFFLSFHTLMAAKAFNLHFEAKLDEYFSFYVSFYYLCQFYCQFFVFFVLLLEYTKSNISIVKKFRKFYYYCFIIVSTLISPPDISSQVVISLIFILIYEFLIFFYLFKLID